MQPKKRRQQILRTLIQKHRLSTQQELVAHLSKFQIEATQSSVSRDLKELGIIRVGGAYAVPSVAALFGSGKVRSIEASGESLIVAKVESGLASAVTVEIDRAEIPDVVGTIAGDDTIFIAVRTRQSQKSVMDRVRHLFGTNVEAH
jgi:transcriptional regulator of arginine metabolism